MHKYIMLGGSSRCTEVMLQAILISSLGIHYFSWPEWVQLKHFLNTGTIWMAQIPEDIVQFIASKAL